MKKPSNPSEYVEWWNNQFQPKIDYLSRKQYEAACVLVRYKFERSSEWGSLISELPEYQASYKQTCGYDLLMGNPQDIRLYEKSWNSFLLKVWRKNVVENDNWDKNNNEPDSGWITPLNWLEKIKDTVRTTIIVKYLDGVGFLLENMSSEFKKAGCECEADWQARDEGYYAAHLNVIKEYEIPFGLDVQKQKIGVEIQINTQIADVIKELTHKYYEQRRVRMQEPNQKWQWDYHSEEFAPNYVGHILHYVDGVVMEIRDRRQLNGGK